MSRHTPSDNRARNLRLRTLAFIAALSVLIVVAITCVTRTVELAAIPDGDKPSDESYAGQISKTYDFKFGANPFSPGNATTTTGTFIPGEMFVPAKRCGTCHTDAHAQWRQSAHGNAFREPFYQKNVKDLQTQKGIEFTRHCESCHNPTTMAFRASRVTRFNQLRAGESAVT